MSIAATATLSTPITASASLNTTITAGSTPTGSVAANDVTPLTGDVVTFTPTWLSITPTNWAVDFGDGNARTTTGATITHKYRNPGTYTVKLFAGSATVGIPVNIQTNYITATEDDLSAYGTLASWVNFQDESNVTETAGRLTNYNDNVTGLDWVIDPLSTTNPLYKTEYDEYGSYKCLSMNPEYLSPTVLNAPVREQNLIIDDISDEIVVDCGTEAAHWFFVSRFENAFVNYRVLTGHTENTYFRFNNYVAFHFRTLLTNVQQSLSGAHWPSGRFNTYEITIDNGTINFIANGTTIHTQTGVTGAFHMGRFGGTAASQNPPITHISFTAFNSVLTGANLTAVRAYHNNKKPSDL